MAKTKSPLRIDALTFSQKGTDFYLFHLNSKVLNQICFSTPRTRNDPEEVQRILNKPRAARIARDIDKPNSLFPTAIVVSLDEDVEVVDTGNANVKTIVFPSAGDPHGFVLDGQHRLEGFKRAKIQFDLPVVALHAADPSTRGIIFADINSKQEKVDDIVTLDIYYHNKALAAEEQKLMDIVHSLGEDSDSPLKGLIKIYQDDKGAVVKSPIMKRFLIPAINATELMAMTSAEAARILKQYFLGISKLWPDEWKGKKTHRLAHSLGLEVMLGTFPAAKNRIDLKHSKQFTAARFAEVLKPLKGIKVDLETVDQKVSLKLDWTVQTMKLFGNQRGRNQLVSQLKTRLYSADRPKRAKSSPS